MMYQYNTRSRSNNLPDKYNPSNLPNKYYPFDENVYQPFSEQQAPAYINDRRASATSTLDSLKNMLDNLVPQTEFERGVKTYLDLLTSQIKEIKVGQFDLRDEMVVRNRNVRHGSIDELSLSVVKTKQYSRRNTVVGLSDTPELQVDLCKKGTFFLSGVNPSDLSVVHSKSSIQGRPTFHNCSIWPH